MWIESLDEILKDIKNVKITKSQGNNNRMDV